MIDRLENHRSKGDPDARTVPTLGRYSQRGWAAYYIAYYMGNPPRRLWPNEVRRKIGFGIFLGKLPGLIPIRNVSVETYRYSMESPETTQAIAYDVLA